MTTVAPSASVPASSSRVKPSAQSRSMVIMLGVLGSLVVVFFFTLLFGGVSGVEFCPQTFTTRSFGFREVPWLGWQLTGVRRNATASDVERWIALNATLPLDESPPRWDLIEGTRGASVMPASGAEILHRYVTATDEQGKSVWERWSREHSEEAKRFWPIVVRLARLELYPLMPDTFAAARAVDKATTLEAALAKRIGPALHDRATWLAAHGEPAKAKALWNLALDLDPSQAEWKKGRDGLAP